MARVVPAERRMKVSVTVDPDLLRAVDEYVAAHASVDRSKVFDAALLLWYGQQQEEAIAAYYREPRSAEEQEERAAWKEIQRAAAERIFGRREG